eukprot:TRINITY_DN21291_c0_g1_i2.p1 TRINITY_DN21291_c0_g1~~TRINITY_DN21291_c0_g1_i2.p1  ORF type:complete len:243 (+),score=21.74 TRINITY_DN21291_c0_g1_i2:47-775(+)
MQNNNTWYSLGYWMNWGTPSPQPTINSEDEPVREEPSNVIVKDTAVVNHIGMNIQELPDEILVNIFSRLNTLYAVLLVNTAFNRIANDPVVIEAIKFHPYNIIVVGATASGKTDLIRRYAKNRLPRPDYKPTLKIKSYEKTILVHMKETTFIIHDVPEAELESFCSRKKVHGQILLKGHYNKFNLPCSVDYNATKETTKSGVGIAQPFYSLMLKVVEKYPPPKKHHNVINKISVPPKGPKKV